MNEEEKLAKKIMELFKENAPNVGDLLLPQRILTFKMKLSPPETNLYSIVEHDLESRDYFGIEGTIDKVQYRLKQAGYDFIYNTLC